MDIDIKYTVYSIIENLISKPVNGNKKICELVNFDNYKQTEIIDAYLESKSKLAQRIDVRESLFSIITNQSKNNLLSIG